MSAHISIKITLQSLILALIRETRAFCTTVVRSCEFCILGSVELGEPYLAAIMILPFLALKNQTEVFPSLFLVPFVKLVPNGNIAISLYFPSTNLLPFFFILVKVLSLKKMIMFSI